MATTLSRRNFIKGAATLAASGAVASCAAQMGSLAFADEAAAPEEEIYCGVCRGNCFSGCFLNVHVRDGQVVRTTARDLPDTQYNRICTKGLTHVFRMYGPTRIKYPMKRIGERGSGEFERISWEEAMDTLITKWNGYVEEFGPSSMAMYTGSGSYGLMTGAQSYACPNQRFINASGCNFINFIFDLAGMLGSNRMLVNGATGAFTANIQTDLVNTDVLFVWSNAELSQPHNMHFIFDAMEKGMKVVVIDPRFTYLAGKAYKYVPVNPGTDGLLMIAMLKTIFENGWENVEFLRKHSTMSFLVKEENGLYLTTADLDDSIAPEDAKECVLTADGKIVAYDEAEDCAFEGSLTTENGIKVNTVYTVFQNRLAEYDIEECSEKCGISLEDIKELADLFANGGNVAAARNPGVTHYTNGVSVWSGIYTLLIVTGQVGQPGKGLALGLSSAGVFDMAGTSLMGNPDVPGGAFGFHQYMGHGMDAMIMDEVMEKHEYNGTEVNLKGMYIATTNPLVTASDRQFMLDWFGKVEFIVVADFSMNETARYADLLLPVAHWFEQEDVFSLFAGHPYTLFQEKAVDPLFESRTDWDILKELAEGIGCGEYFDMTVPEYIDLAFGNASAKASGLSYAALKENKAMLNLQDDQFIYAKDCTFGTKYNRASVYQVDVTPKGNSGQSYDIDKYRMIYWEPATESYPGNPNLEKFPFQMISPHSRFRTHSQWWDVACLKEIDKELFVLINKDDAAELGVTDGDYVKLYNDRGHAVVAVGVTAGLPRGVISVDGCWEESEMVDGCINSLNGHYSDPFIRDTPLYDVIVGIEKVS